MVLLFNFTALTLPFVCSNRSLDKSIQAALTNDLVKVPAHTAPSGANSKARSKLPERFNAALTPEALKPVGIVIPPGMMDHCKAVKGLTTFQRN